MSSLPRISRRGEAIGAAVFSRIAHRMAALDPASSYPLHIGDTWMPPFADLASLLAEAPELHRYGSTQGEPWLREAISQHRRQRGGPQASAEEILVTSGATGALSVAAGATLNPGDEVLVLAPYWPLIRGILQSHGAQPVELPFWSRFQTPSEALAALEAAWTPRTRAIYLSNPSNPTGEVIGEDWLRALVQWARSRDLWIYADEVYEDLVYEGAPCWAGLLAPERTLSAFSFSKAYGLSGYRVGYLLGPTEALTAARKFLTHSLYCAPLASQYLAMRALELGGPWQARARESYHQVGREVAAILNLPAPKGSGFFFLDVSEQLDERGLWGFLEDCLEDRLTLAPGTSFGSGYETYVRISYTASPPERVLQAAELLARRLG